MVTDIVLKFPSVNFKIFMSSVIVPSVSLIGQFVTEKAARKVLNDAKRQIAKKAILNLETLNM